MGHYLLVFLVGLLAISIMVAFLYGVGRFIYNFFDEPSPQTLNAHMGCIEYGFWGSLVIGVAIFTAFGIIVIPYYIGLAVLHFFH